MAGSFSPVFSEEDHIFNARLEGLKLLADQVSEPVVIFDPSLQLVYANAQAEPLVSTCPILDGTNSLVRETHSPETCKVCPAKDLLGTSLFPVSPNLETSCVNKDPLCPFPTSFPIEGNQGVVGCVVMMGKSAEDSIVWKKPVDNFELMTDLTPGLSRSHDPALIGQSAAMQQVSDMIGLVAKSESTVLIEGESGTGKELVAKTIHKLSPRRDHPFVVVECSSLPETLLESELFGHVRGAFTGAVSDRKGLFEEAEGGTIFLDEIAETIPIFQAKLLRVLQEGEIKPVGSNKSIKVNVRVISASNKRLSPLIEEKLFRSDLYYRLAVLPLTVPPLRERREDIPLLVKHFLKQSCSKNGKAGISIPHDTLEALTHYDWPGNVRELENIIERAIVVAQHSTLSIRDIFGEVHEQPESSDLPSLSKAARQAVEKQEILKALQETQGDKTRAARLLNISRANLYNKLKAYQL